jgi:hypothetical protein
MVGLTTGGKTLGPTGRETFLFHQEVIVIPMTPSIGERLALARAVVEKVSSKATTARPSLSL